NLFASGLASNAAYWHPDPANHNLGPFFGLSALPGTCASHAYLWITGEPVSYTSWDGVGPTCAAGSYAAGFSTSNPLAVGSTWNDTSLNANAYVVEFDEYPPAYDRIYVTNRDANSVTAYRRTASGDTAPSQTISGAATGLNTPHGIAVDQTHGEIFVANLGANSITVYDLAARGNAPPVRTLSGGSTLLDRPQGIAVDVVNGELVVANRSDIFL